MQALDCPHRRMPVMLIVWHIWRYHGLITFFSTFNSVFMKIQHLNPKLQNTRILQTWREHPQNSPIIYINTSFWGSNLQDSPAKKQDCWLSMEWNNARTLEEWHGLTRVYSSPKYTWSTPQNLSHWFQWEIRTIVHMSHICTQPIYQSASWK